MSATVFCNFEQQDMADLAMGKLKASIKGIKSIHYITARNNEVSVYNSNYIDSTISPSQVTVKIACADNSVNMVVSRLVNLHAHQIITTR